MLERKENSKGLYLWRKRKRKDGEERVAELMKSEEWRSGLNLRAHTSNNAQKLFFPGGAEKWNGKSRDCSGVSVCFGPELDLEWEKYYW